MSNEYQGGYTRRQELTCTEAQIATYADIVLHENEKIYVRMNSGVIRMKLGDGVTNLRDLPYTKVFDGDLVTVEAWLAEHKTQVEAQIESKFDKANIAQELGDDPNKVLSQAATTRELNQLSEDIVDVSGLIDSHLVKKIRSVNLLSSNEFTNQSIKSTGEVVDSTVDVLTDFFECESNRTISLTRIISGSYGAYVRGKSNVYSVGFYDRNKDLISVAGGTPTVITDKDFITPENTKYVRICFEKAYSSTYQVMVEYSENGISETYVAYFEPYYVYNENIDNEVVIGMLVQEKSKLEKDLKSLTMKSPFPMKPSFVKKSGQYNGCLSDIRTVDGVDVLYGFSGASVVRSANGTNCGSPHILMTTPFSGGTVNFIKKLDDGTLLAGVENAGGTGYAKLYKGTAEVWNTSTLKFDVTWTEVFALDTSGVYFSMWFGLSIYKNIIVVGEYGAHNVARHVYISRDYGNTWNKIFAAELDDSGAGVHIHDVCYDPYSDVIWICTGDGYWAQNVYFSYDGGATWNKNYGYKESPSQFTQILPLPNCVLFTTDNTKHMAVYRCNRADIRAKKTHLDLELAYTFYDNYDAESPIGTNGCVVYGKDACVYFGWAERYDVAKTKSPVIGTKDGYNFFVVWENETVTATTSSYNGIFGVYGVSDNGNIAISYVNKEDGTTGKHSIIMQAPEWV